MKILVRIVILIVSLNLIFSPPAPLTWSSSTCVQKNTTGRPSYGGAHLWTDNKTLFTFNNFSSKLIIDACDASQPSFPLVTSKTGSSIVGHTSFEYASGGGVYTTAVISPSGVIYSFQPTTNINCRYKLERYTYDSLTGFTLTATTNNFLTSTSNSSFIMKSAVIVPGAIEYLIVLIPNIVE
jgi:hypothetical protein